MPPCQSVAVGILVVQAVDKVQKIVARDVEVQVEFVEQVVVRDQVRLLFIIVNDVGRVAQGMDVGEVVGVLGLDFGAKSSATTVDG